MKRWGAFIQRLIFMLARALPSRLNGLMGLHLIHFARWVLIRRDQWPDLGQGKQTLKYDYMLFCSNFNGTWDQYIDAFSDAIPSGLDLFWYASIKYPHSVPITAFKNYITHNQIDTDYYYNATPGAAQRDIKAALSVFAAIRELAALHPGSNAEAFASAYRASLLKVQNCLGSQGIAPVASLDAENAERNRAEFLMSRKNSSSRSPYAEL
ncbi:MAG: hypothetical protein WDN46_23425 [Methylocella sp.]